VITFTLFAESKATLTCYFFGNNAKEDFTTTRFLPVVIAGFMIKAVVFTRVLWTKTTKDTIK